MKRKRDEENEYKKSLEENQESGDEECSKQIKKKMMKIKENKLKKKSDSDTQNKKLGLEKVHNTKTIKRKRDEENEKKKSLEENQESGDEECSKQIKKKMMKRFKEKKLKQKSDSDTQNKKLGKQSKKMKKIKELQQNSYAQKNALEYLRKWQSDQENWKFKKVRQIWLLQNMYNKDKIGEEDFDILVRYLEPLRGIARATSLSEAEEIMKTFESKEETDMGDGEKLKVQRALRVIQILSIEPGQ